MPIAANIYRRALRGLLAVISLGAVFNAVGQAASPDVFPDRPITLVTTTPAAGSVDTVARLLASELSKSLGRPVIVDPRPGASGNIAAAYVAKAPADGYTLMITVSGTMTTNIHFYKALQFDPESSFSPIVMPARMNMILVVHPKWKISDVRDLISLLKGEPGKLNYASGGLGTVTHLAAEIFSLRTATRGTHIPYKGLSQIATDLLAGQIDYMFDSATAIPHIRSGKLHALAVVGPNRVPALPEVGTFKDLGIEGMEIANGWYGIYAPAGTPSAIVQRLNSTLVEILKMESTIKKIQSIGLEPTFSSPQELAAIQRATTEKMGEVIRAANIGAAR